MRGTIVAAWGIALGLAACQGRQKPTSMSSPVDGAGPPDAGTAEVSDDRTPTCGTAGLACCSNNTCAVDGCCVLGRCVAAGEACGCLAGTCQAASCGPCGGLDQPCCERPSFGFHCTAPGTGCSPERTCRPCAVAGAPCCEDFTCPGPALECRAIFFGGPNCEACGMPGTPCCGGTRCLDGGCCVNQICVAKGDTCGTPGAIDDTCGDGRCAACGGRGQACCTNRCHEAFTSCQGGDGGRACAACGGAGEPCCPALGRSASPTFCRDNANCISSAAGQICEACGGPGQLCCPGSKCAGASCCWGVRCVGEGEICAGTGRCRGGSCACGKIGEGCCPTQPQCAEAGSQCFSIGVPSLCTRCGIPGGPCCADGVCAGCCVNVLGSVPPDQCVGAGGACPDGGTCTTAGSCTSCGAPGQPCCERGNILYCTTDHAACLPDPASPTAFSCSPCGHMGERCCLRPSIRGSGWSGGSCLAPLTCADGKTCGPRPGPVVCEVPPPPPDVF